jgi:5-methylthioadenosine/S-adenosylhomocysteine deaminase
LTEIHDKALSTGIRNLPNINKNTLSKVRKRLHLPRFETMDNVDLVINARWIVPVEPDGVVLENHALVINSGHIVDLLSQADVAERYTATDQIDRPNHILMPGLINAHTHTPMTLFRGMADDMPLDEWLGQHIWPAEARWAGVEFVRDGAELAMIEMIRGGTTCFQDMYFFPDVVAQAAVDRNIRAVVGMIMINQPTIWAQTTEEYFSKGLAVHDQFAGNPLVHTTFAPHAPYTVDDESLQRMRVLADELDTHVHTHLHETAGEISDAIAADGRRPIQRLQELGLINPLLTAVHMTQLTDAEIALIADAGASVVHCPESNLKLASGFCPVAKLLAAGVNVALGTDGAASNNDLDMFSEMRTAALLAKGVSGDAGAVTAVQALAMATINGAKALGIAGQTGSLVAGKSADLTCVDIDSPATQPVHNPISQLVYSVNRDQVSDVWVGGIPVLQNGNLTHDNQAEILERAAAWQRRLTEGDS